MNPRPGCSLDPATGKPRADDAPPHAPATVALDRHSAFVLCDACAEGPKFRKKQRFLMLDDDERNRTVQEQQEGPDA